MFLFDGGDRRKEEERVRKENRLPPGQSLTLKFPVLHYGPISPLTPLPGTFAFGGKWRSQRLGVGPSSINSRAPR